jgi:hypothetical protein
MENVIVNGNAVSLATLRTGVAEGEQRAYGARREYAKHLNTHFTFDWFEVEHTDTSAEAKLVHAEKKALFAELKRVHPDHKNPSTVWANIRKYGRDEKYPKPQAAEGEAAEGEAAEGEAAEGEAAGNRNKAPMLRNVDDLVSLYKFNMRQTELPDKVASAQVYIVKALEALGVDLALIK